MILRDGQHRLTLRDQSTAVHRRLSLSTQSTYGVRERLTLTDGGKTLKVLTKDHNYLLRCDHEQ